MRILLISPGDDNDLHLHAVRRVPYLMSDAFFAPHACAAVAALTPPAHDVRIHDEHLHGPVDALLDRERFDVVGVSLLMNQYGRTRAIARRFRERRLQGKLVVGGMGTAFLLPRLRDLADTLFVGEAEETWPRYLEELAAGREGRLYREVARPDMALVPMPRWELVARDIPRYASVSVQTSRGCPWDCSFCDVIYTFGRRLRLKPVGRVVEEVRRAERLGARMVYFADDNFAADRAYTKELLRRLAPLNRSFAVQLSFMTQLDVTVAGDDELLQLLLDANFAEVQVGIESTSEAALREVNKLQNTRVDPVAAVRTIQSYGIVVLAHMIVGMDADGPDAFERTRRFLREADVVHHVCHPLQAPPGTRLWYALKRQGRIVDPTDEMSDRMDMTTNIVPRRMTRVELMEGLAHHWLAAVEPDEYLPRLRRFLRGIAHVPTVPAGNTPSPWALRRMLLTLLRYYLLDVPRDKRVLFLRILAEARRLDRRLLPRLFFVQSLHTLEWLQAREAAARVRRQAAWERALPGGVPLMAASLPVPGAVRDGAREIVPAAYRRVRARLAGRREVYRAVQESIVDFVDRFGGTFETMDGYHADALEKSCDRVLDAAGAPSPPVPPDEGDGGLPADRPPPGFTREMLDAVDEALRLRSPG